MSSGNAQLHPNEKIKMGPLAGRIMGPAGGTGVVFLLVAVIWGYLNGDGMDRFFHSYLWAFAFFLSIAVGATFFVILQHLVSARWSVTIRRIAEILSMTWPVLFILLLVILVPMLLGSDSLYLWSNQEVVAHDHVLQKKEVWLNVPFFTVRLLVYFIALWGLARFFFQKSVEQDLTGEERLTGLMRKVSGPGMIAYAFLTALIAFDLLMSLEPHWFSTIYGVYYYAGSCIAVMALLALIPMALQGSGRLRRSITVEHYHDVGKLLFAFIFFWGYIGFSQYMLIWAANLPEETIFFDNRSSLGQGFEQLGWGWISLALIFLHFALPFVCLLSRWTKRLSIPIGSRRVPVLALFAAYMLFMHAVDIYWLVMPSYNPNELVLHPIDVLNFLGIGGLFIARAAQVAGKVNLLPVKDPRLGESLAFENQ